MNRDKLPFAIILLLFLTACGPLTSIISGTTESQDDLEPPSIAEPMVATVTGEAPTQTPPPTEMPPSPPEDSQPEMDSDDDRPEPPQGDVQPPAPELGDPPRSLALGRADELCEDLLPAAEWERLFGQPVAETLSEGYDDFGPTVYCGVVFDDGAPIEEASLLIRLYDSPEEAKQAYEAWRVIIEDSAEEIEPLDNLGAGAYTELTDDFYSIQTHDGAYYIEVAYFSEEEFRMLPLLDLAVFVYERLPADMRSPMEADVGEDER